MPYNLEKHFACVNNELCSIMGTFSTQILLCTYFLVSLKCIRVSGLNAYLCTTLRTSFPSFFFFKELLYLFYFWLHQVLVAESLQCSGFSLVEARELSFSAACGILVLRPGIEPTSPALEGGFLTTGPPGKSQKNCFKALVINT